MTFPPLKMRAMYCLAPSVLWWLTAACRRVRTVLRDNNRARSPTKGRLSSRSLISRTGTLHPWKSSGQLTFARCHNGFVRGGNRELGRTLVAAGIEDRPVADNHPCLADPLAARVASNDG